MEKANEGQYLAREDLLFVLIYVVCTTVVLKAIMTMFFIFDAPTMLWGGTRESSLEAADRDVQEGILLQSRSECFGRWRQS